MMLTKREERTMLMQRRVPLTRYMITVVSVVCVLTGTIFSGRCPAVQGADPAPSGSDWPMVSHDALRTSNTDSNITPPFVEGGVLQTGEPINTIPAVADGLLVVGDEAGQVSCFDITKNSLRWHTGTAASVRGSPCIDGQRVYAGSDDGFVYALSMQDGAVLWKFRTGGKVQASPLAVSGVVYAGSLDGHVYAVASSTGTELWDYTCQGRVFGAPAFMAGRLYTGDDAGFVHCIDASSGTAVWTRKLTTTVPGLTSGIIASPVLDPLHEYLYVGSANHRLYCMDMDSGADHHAPWDLGAPVFSSVSLGEGIVIAASQIGLFCYDRATGLPKWSYPMSGYYAGTCAITAGYVLFSEPRGSLTALDLGQGETQWFASFGEDGSRCSPIVADGRVIMAVPSGKILSFVDKRILAMPVISCRPGSLDFGTVAGGSKPSLPLYVFNANRDVSTGGVIGLLQGVVTSDVSWLSVSPTLFSGNETTLWVSADSTHLTPGTTSTGHVMITSNGGDLTINAEISVQEVPGETVVLLYVGSSVAYVDGKLLTLDVAPVIDAETGRTLVPVRAISEARGAVVSWNPATKSVMILFGSTSIVLHIDSATALVNGQTRMLDQPAVVVEGRTLVPLRFVAEALGGDVEWNGATREIKITFKR